MTKPKNNPCPECGVQPGAPCIVTLYPPAGPLSIKWQHAAREKAAA